MLKTSDSWAEIAEYVGANSEVLEATINEYNSFCELGNDRIFTKDRRFLTALQNPPYYAIKCCLGFLGTIGGIKINHRMEVLNNQDNPIPGLYAVGVDTGGWESYTYCSLLSGSTLVLPSTPAELRRKCRQLYSGNNPTNLMLILI